MHRSILTTIAVCLASLILGQAVFTTSGTFVVPPGVTSITVELIGAGGNGYTNGGGGGGGGGYARGTYTVVPGTSYSVIVGAGGSELATIVGGLGILAGAGENGTMVPNPGVGGGGAGGVAMGGSLARNGGAGGGGYYTYFGGGGGGAAASGASGGAGGNTITWTGICLTPGGAAGNSGGAPAGTGGKGAGFTDNNCSVSDPAGNGASYGGGGGGGNGIGSPVGIGGGGWCSITWDINTQVAANEAVRLFVPPIFTERIVPVNAKGTERFELFDATGRRVWTGLHIEQQGLDHLLQGSYFLRVFDGDALRTLRLVKQ